MVESQHRLGKKHWMFSSRDGEARTHSMTHMERTLCFRETSFIFQQKENT